MIQFPSGSAHAPEADIFKLMYVDYFILREICCLPLIFYSRCNIHVQSGDSSLVDSRILTSISEAKIYCGHMTGV